MPLEEAENVKLGGFSRTTFAKKKLDEIISARLDDCFELIQNHLKKIGRNALLPAGIILTGGTASTPGMKMFAEEELRLPAQVAEIHFGGNDKNKIRDTIWATACGLVLIGFNANDEGGFLGSRKNPITTEVGKNLFRQISRWFKQFLP